MKYFFYLFAFWTFSLLSFSVQSEECPMPDCWVPKLNFDIEGAGFVKSMIFLSGQSYALSAVQDLAMNQKSSPLFCGLEYVSSKEVIEIVNASLSGVVTSEQVTDTVIKGLANKYTCK